MKTSGGTSTEHFYWQKNVWILPIHRSATEHWVTCVIYLQECRLLLFDSLAGRTWSGDIQDITTLISRFIFIATKNDKDFSFDIIIDGWSASPTCIVPMQTNGYNCGVWVLACIAAVLRGYHLPAIKESDIVVFRSFLSHLALSLPVS
jgi:Ulp1 family protease